MRLPLLAFAAVTSAASAQPHGAFDARAWLAEATPLLTDATYAFDYDDPRTARIKALAGHLDEAVDWQRGCDTYWDPVEGVLVHDPVPEDDGHGSRGVMALLWTGDDEAVVAVTCYFGAYQGSYALVHLRGERAALVHTRDFLLENGGFAPEPTAVFGTPSFDGHPPGVFETHALSRGLGDCGLHARYRLTDLGEATPLLIRARDCDAPCDDPEGCLDPLTWPVVFAVD
jgi:hypothetical protein